MTEVRQPTLLRIGEIFLKGKNRHLFFNKFVRNARQLFADMEDVEVERRHLQVVLWHPPNQPRRVAARLDRLFGLESYSHATGTGSTIEDITDTAVNVAQGLPPGGSFKVETKRADKSFPMTSPDISRHVGGTIAARTGRPVNVQRPDHVVRVAITRDGSYVYDTSHKGPGGLPVGTSGRVTLLLSGGIDSPVAGWSTMRRGCTLQAVYFHSFPYTGDKTKAKVVNLASKLATFQRRLALHVVHFTDVQKQLRDVDRDDLAVLLYRRMMVRTASRLAARNASSALVTGDNLGQVASQTLANLAVIEDAAELPILRPLITLDKSDIIAQAQRIGTYETSIEPYEDACQLFVPKHPATAARIQDARRAEASLDVDTMADNLAEGVETIILPNTQSPSLITGSIS